MDEKDKKESEELWFRLNVAKMMLAGATGAGFNSVMERGEAERVLERAKSLGEAMVGYGVSMATDEVIALIRDGLRELDQALTDEGMIHPSGDAMQTRVLAIRGLIFATVTVNLFRLAADRVKDAAENGADPSRAAMWCDGGLDEAARMYQEQGRQGDPLTQLQNLMKEVARRPEDRDGDA